MSFVRWLLVGIVSSAILSLPLRAQSHEAGFVVLIGQDTIARERFRRSSMRLEGELFDRTTGVRRKYNADLLNGRVVRLDTWVWRVDDAPNADPERRSIGHFSADSAVLKSISGTSTQVHRVAIQSHTLPYINLSFALMELLTNQFRAAGVKEGPFLASLLVGAATVPVTVNSVGADTVVISLAGADIRLRLDSAGRTVEGTIPGQRVRIERVDSIAASRFGVSAPDYSAPADASFTAEDIRVSHGDHEIVGTLTRPRRFTGRLPVAITVSGSGLQDRDESIFGLPGYRPFRQLAENLANRNIAVFRYDDRGFGASTGNAATSTLADFAADLRAVIHELRNRRDLDPDRIALIGHSEGGLISPWVARDDPGIAALVLLAAPALPGTAIVDSQILYSVNADTTLQGAARDSALRVAQAEIDSVAKATPWIRDFLAYEPLTVIRKVRQPVLILQGSSDRQITANQAALLAAALRRGGNKRVQMEVFAGLNHLFLIDPIGNPATYTRLSSTRVPDAVINRIGNWLATVLAARDP